ncbi:MAG: hypothetical protein K0Q87_4696, partial [Neobacillus sp.]|nr:hypothetical protein [Neobacillus sp.]
MSKIEGKHYEKRNSKSKETYSVRSLVEEITGISPNEQGFDAAYKEVQRIIGVFQGLDGVTEGTIKVPKEQKGGFIKAT